MSFFRRTKIYFDAKMNLNRPTLKPNTAARGKIGWFLNFNQSEKRAIKEPCLGLLIWRHSQLDVIEAVGCHERGSVGERRTHEIRHFSCEMTHNVRCEGPPILATFIYELRVMSVEH